MDVEVDGFEGGFVVDDFVVEAGESDDEVDVEDWDQFSPQLQGEMVAHQK